MGRITSEEIERTKIESVPHMYKVTIAQGNGNYKDCYIQQITEKTIVLIWDYKTVYRLNLDGTARSQRHGVSMFQIDQESLKKMYADLKSRNLKTYHCGFRPFNLDKELMVDRPKLKEYYKHVDNQHEYVVQGRKIIDCTINHGEPVLNVVKKQVKQ